MSTAAAAAANENGNEDKNEEKTSEFLLVVITFIATVAFQAGINPPGGVWQDASDPRAGQSIMATRQPGRFIGYIATTSVCMAFSLVKVIVIISLLPYDRLPVSKYFLLPSCAFTIGAMGTGYWLAVAALTPAQMLQQIIRALIANIVIGVVVLSVSVFIERRTKCRNC